MAIAIALPGFNDLGRSVTPTLLSRNRFHLVAQWIERQPGVREVMGSIPVGDSEFFFVPRSCHVD